MKTIMQELKPKLEAEGFAVFYKAAESDESSDQLILPVAKEDGSALSIELHTIADPQNMYPQNTLIQIFMSVVVEIKEEKFADIRHLIEDINLELTLGSFHLHPSGIVFFKYTFIAAKENTEAVIHPLMDAIDISNHVFQSVEPHILNFLNS